MEPEEIIKKIHERLGNISEISAYERVLIQYVVEITLKSVKK